MSKLEPTTVLNMKERRVAEARALVHSFIVRSVGEDMPGMDEQAQELVAELDEAGLLQ